MELYAFASEFPELFAMLNETVRSTIAANNMTGEESLRDWDNMIDNFVSNFEYEDYYGQEMGESLSQQIPFDGFGDRDRDTDRDRRRRRRRRFHDFNLRDIIRLLFLRQLFDRNRF